MFATNEVPPENSTRRAVIVEVGREGARIREAPPDVLVMVVESREISEGGRRSVAAGGRAGGDGLLSLAPEDRAPVRVRQIPVSFPG